MHVIWLTMAASAGEGWFVPVPTGPTDLAAVVEAGATSGIEPRAAGAAASLRRLDALDTVLDEVRPFEAQLDGELVILQRLGPVVESLEVLRNPEDAARLFRVLAYQGFAAHRFFGDRLAVDPAAEPWRVQVADQVVERPWRDAVALDPKRRVTPYDIAEAPQRIAFESRRAGLVAALPGFVQVPSPVTGEQLRVNGRPAEPSPDGVLTLPPGRHFVHLEVAGQTVERWTVEVASTESSVLERRIDPAAYTAFLARAGAGETVPDPVRQVLAQLDQPVWLIRPEGDDVVVLDPSSGTLTEADWPRPVAASNPEPRGEIAVGALAGWLGSPDFYFQDPLDAPPTFSTVNAVSLGGYVAGQLRVGAAAVGAGADVIVPLGPRQVALTGDQRLRVRPVPYVAAGLPWLQAAVGWVFPYHAAGGLRGRWPLGDAFEARLVAWAAPAPRRAREGADDWDGNPLVTVTGGIGWRIGVGKRR